MVSLQRSSWREMRVSISQATTTSRRDGFCAADGSRFCAARFCAACLEHSAAPYPFAGGAPPGAPPPAPSPPPSPHHPPVPTVGPHAIVNPYAHQNNQCWRGHQRATLLGQLVADASSVYTFACQIYYNRLLMLHWAATARMAAEGGGAGGPVHAHVEHGRLRVAVEVSPKCAAAGA